MSGFESGNLGMGTDRSCHCKLEELIIVGSDFLVKSDSAAMSDGTSCFILFNLSKTSCCYIARHGMKLNTLSLIFACLLCYCFDSLRFSSGNLK